MKWKNPITCPPKPGKYLVTLVTDYKKASTEILYFDGRDWYIDNQKLYETPYYCEVVAYTKRPKPSSEEFRWYKYSEDEY